MIIVMGTFSFASAGRISIGGFAGWNIPLYQKDVETGKVFGAKGRIILLPFLGVEPNFVFSEYGDKDYDVDGQILTRKGGDITSFGADVVWGSFDSFSPARFYGILGINSNTLKRQGFADLTRLGVSLGSGVELLVTDVFSIEIRARIHAISLEGGGGRNNLELTGGVNYYFGPE